MNNGINKKQELILKLKKYKGILNRSMMDYLYSIVNLEFSVVRENISSEERELLSELDIYKQIAIYNIYNRALNLFEGQKRKYIVYDNDKGFDGLTISKQINDDKIKLFNFNYNDKMCKISLYQIKEIKEIKEFEMDIIKNKLKQLYELSDTYSFERYKKGYIGSPITQNSYNNHLQIFNYEKLLNNLNSKKEPTDLEKIQIKLTNKYLNLLLEDYGLTNESFKENDTVNVLNGNLNKTLVKKIPFIEITQNIKYY